MPKFKLTKKKQKWVKQFKPTAIMRGKPLNYPATVEAKYIKDLEKLTRQVMAETEKEIRKIFSGQAAKQYFAADESVASQSRILLNKLFSRLDKAIAKRSKTISMQMVKNTDKASASGLNSSLKELSGGLSIKTSTIGPVVSERLKASIDVNVDLIKSIQSQYLDGVKDAVDRSIQTGNGLQDLLPYLEKQEGITLRRARMIALDQTRKAYNSLNAARMQDVGVQTYEWLHTGGSQEPRPHHLNSWPNGLNTGIFRLDEPPIIDLKTGERGIPGQAINCRCRMLPVISFDEGEPET